MRHVVASLPEQRDDSAELLALQRIDETCTKLQQQVSTDSLRTLPYQVQEYGTAGTRSLLSLYGTTCPYLQ
jgi:hypothetical protein